MKEKLISVIIPTYNRAGTIADAVQSVKNQTYPNIQLIVIDDGSSDQTTDVLKFFPDIEYHYQDNGGQASARNAGLRRARGEYIASLDSDDVWNPDFIEKAAECLEKHELDFVFLNWINLKRGESFLDFWERTNVWSQYSASTDGEWILLDADNLRSIFLTACPTPSSSFLLRRSSMVEWNENIKVADDWLLLLEMVLNKPSRAAFTLTPYWQKRIFGDNIYDGRNVLQVAENNVADDFLMAERIYRKLSKQEKSLFRKRRSNNYLNYAYHNFKHKNYDRRVWESVGKALGLSPTTVGRYSLGVVAGGLKKKLRPDSPTKVEAVKHLTE